jgi:hypothetical protein
MRLRIAVTDNDWFRYLRSLPAVDEVNFWQPSGELSVRLAPILEPGGRHTHSRGRKPGERGAKTQTSPVKGRIRERKGLPTGSGGAAFEQPGAAAPGRRAH